MLAKRVAASQYEDAVCCGAEGVVFEYYVDQGRGRACGEACSGGLGHKHPPHSPLGPCRGGVCVVAA